MIEHVDILIAGGGPVGATLALALQGHGLRVMVLEAQQDHVPRKDARTLAISYGSRLILERLDIWRKLPEATAINTIHVSQRGGFGSTALSASQSGVPALGYVLDYSALNHALHTALQDSATHYHTGARVTRIETTPRYAVAHFEDSQGAQQVTANLLVLADGGRGLGEIKGITRRVRDYHQSAVVAQVETELPHANVAFERFTPGGPVALLPSQDGFSLVWTVQPDQAENLCQLDDARFLEKLHDHFGDRVGKFISVGKRAHFPLSLKYAVPITGQRLVLIGNAAQILHPVAGQGFNLGLRDAWELSTLLASTAPAAIGEQDTLLRYQAQRRVDTDGGILFTDALVRGFSNDYMLLRQGRGLLLAAMGTLPPLKKFLARKMMFGARG